MSPKPIMQKADPIVGIRIALNPIVRRPDGSEELLGEIAAKILDIPGDLEFLQRVSATTVPFLTWLGEA